MNEDVRRYMEKSIEMMKNSIQEVRNDAKPSPYIGAVSTLEPCASGARHFPKLGCSERIVNARLKKVYIGIEDSDPTVDRKGIKCLQDNDIEVEMYPPELQKEIMECNKGSFIGLLLFGKNPQFSYPNAKVKALYINSCLYLWIQVCLRAARNWELKCLII